MKAKPRKNIKKISKPNHYQITGFKSSIELIGVIAHLEAMHCLWIKSGQDKVIDVIGMGKTAFLFELNDLGSLCKTFGVTLVVLHGHGN